VNKNSEV